VKKILFIINSLGQGGAERSVVNLANKMAELHEVSIISLYNNYAYDLDIRIQLIDLALKNDRLSKLKNSFYLKNLLDRQVSKLENDRPFDLITLHLPFTHLVCKDTYFANRSYFVIHTVFSKEMSIKKAKYLTKRIYNNKKIISVSAGVENEILNIFNVKPSFNKVIYNPFDFVEIRRKSKAEFHYDKPYLLGIGRLEPNKRFNLLIDAYAMSKFSHSHDLIILGEGSEHLSLVSQVGRLNLENKVKFMGWVQNPYVWLKHADIHIVTSSFESLGNTIIEALSVNTRVVSVDCDYGPREILVGTLADFLVDDNADSIAKNMECAMDYYPENSVESTSKFKINAIINEYLELD